jgi:hypothetical protein
MIKEDRAAGIAEDDGEDDEVQHAGFLRALTPISAKNSFGTCAKLRSDLDKKVRDKVEAVDDPMLVQCLEQYKGKLLLDDDTQGTYKVVDVNLTEWAKRKYWSASCVPMELKSGHWVVSESAIAGGGLGLYVYMHDALEMYNLANVTDPENPKEFDEMDVMVAAHNARSSSTDSGKRKRN